MRILFLAGLCIFVFSGSQAEADDCNRFKTCNHMAYCVFTYRSAEWKQEPDVHGLLDALWNDRPGPERTLTAQCQAANKTSDSWNNDAGACSDEDINLIGRNARVNNCGVYAQPTQPPHNQYCINCQVTGTPQVCGKSVDEKLHSGSSCQCDGHSGTAFSTPNAPCD